MASLKRNLFIMFAAFLIGSVSFSGTIAFAVETQADWDYWFNKYYGTQDPMLDSTEANTAGKLSWHAHYWVRAYVMMAKTFKDTKYLDKAVTMIDFLLSNRDKIRDANGIIDVAAEPYGSAPLYFLKNPSVPAPGWRIWVSNSQWRIQTLDDGMITHAIMRFVDLVYNNPEYASYQAKAEQYLAAVEEIVPLHDSLFVYDRFDKMPGSYYYPKPDGTGLWSGAVPYNHSATMGVTLLLLDKVKGGVPEYRRKAEALLGYLKDYLRLQANDSYVWDYAPQYANGVEDFNHAHVDISFVVLAYKRGLSLTEQDMKRFANTLTKNLYLGNGELAETVDGVEPNTNKNYYPIGFDWIDLAEFDPTILDIAKEVYNKYYSKPSWCRDLQGWAEIMWWTKMLEKPSPPQNLRVIDSSAQ